MEKKFEIAYEKLSNMNGLPVGANMKGLDALGKAQDASSDSKNNLKLSAQGSSIQDSSLRRRRTVVDADSPSKLGGRSPTIVSKSGTQGEKN